MAGIPWMVGKGLALSASGWLLVLVCVVWAEETSVGFKLPRTQFGCFSETVCNSSNAKPSQMQGFLHHIELDDDAYFALTLSSSSSPGVFVQISHLISDEVVFNAERPLKFYSVLAKGVYNLAISVPMGGWIKTCYHYVIRVPGDLAPDGGHMQGFFMRSMMRYPKLYE